MNEDLRGKDPRWIDVAGAACVAEDIDEVLRENLGPLPLFTGIYSDHREHKFWVEVGGHPEIQGRGTSRTLAHVACLASLLEHVEACAASREKRA